MKIQPSSLRPAPEAAARTTPGAAARPAAPAAAQGSAQVALSATSSALQSSSADVNLERVQALREAIRSGQLQIDTGRIADGLLESTRELLKHSGKTV